MSEGTQKSMNEDKQKRRKGIEGRDHRATNIPYKRAIIQAIDELQDVSLRSNIDAIRRHVEASFDPAHIWNDTVFLKTLKGLIHDGDIEPLTQVNFGLSREFKKRRTSSMTELLEKKRSKEIHDNLTYPYFTRHHSFEEKDTPAKKQEHFKLKIIPKKEYDKLHVPIKNPMDTY